MFNEITMVRLGVDKRILARGTVESMRAEVRLIGQ